MEYTSESSCDIKVYMYPFPKSTSNKLNLHPVSTPTFIFFVILIGQILIEMSETRQNDSYSNLVEGGDPIIRPVSAAAAASTLCKAIERK